MASEHCPASPPSKPSSSTDSPLVGRSQALESLRRQIQEIADTDFPVLITGESGSGKELVARWGLHQQTRRGGHPFLALNCAALSPCLMEATLFGHARGAYTGAQEARPGYFEEAGAGTLLLDEIGELSLELQPKLLRVLENGEYQRVGETRPRFSQARIIAATNRDLRQAIRQGAFRPDLYHRLDILALRVPPLRELGEDRLILFDHYRQLVARQLNTSPVRLSPAARDLWLNYAFPGNVRELRNIIIRLHAKHPGQCLNPGQLLPELDTETSSPPATNDLQNLFGCALQHLSSQEHSNLEHLLERWGQAYMEAALHLSQGNLSQAARRLNISRSTFYSRRSSWPRE